MQKHKIIVTKQYRLFPSVLSQTRIISITKKELISKGVKRIIEEKTKWKKGYEFALVNHINYEKENATDSPFSKN